MTNTVRFFIKNYINQHIEVISAAMTRYTVTQKKNSVKEIYKSTTEKGEGKRLKN